MQVTIHYPPLTHCRGFCIILIQTSRMKKKRAKRIKRAIKLVFDSLESHLRYTHLNTEEGKKFHKKCVDEYATVIKLLAKLY